MTNKTNRVLSALPYTLFFAIAAAWTVLTLSGAPQIVPTADGGNVASIVAAELHPDRFVDDPVFSQPQNFRFYQTLTIPAAAAIAHLTGDIGTAYMLLGLPMVLLQMVGFYLVGRKLFGRRFWPFVLAVVSIPPVYVFAGELWGMLASPLTRSAFSAAFPFLLLAALYADRPWKVWLVMALCGVSVYLHPVSAPSVAFGILTMIIFAKPPQTTWTRHLATAFLGGLIFIACAVPFALGFMGSFANSTSSEVAATLTETLRAGVGDQYYNAFLASALFVGTVFGSPLWLLPVWCVAVAAPVILLFKYRESRVLLILAFAIGLGLATVCITLLDQGIALARASHPVQVDLIRNVRFFVPVLLILLCWLMAAWSRRALIRPLPYLAGLALIGIWWLAYPNPIVGQNAFARPVTSQDDKRLLAFLSALPSGTRILPLPYISNSEEASLLALAIRYEALQPTTFLWKDMNFLAYSGSDSIVTWHDMAATLKAIDSGSSNPNALRNLLAKTSTRYVLVHRSSSQSTLSAVASIADEPETFGDWQLFPVPSR